MNSVHDYLIQKAIFCSSLCAHLIDLDFYNIQRFLRLSHRNSVCLFVRPSVQHTGGSIQNGAS